MAWITNYTLAPNMGGCSAGAHGPQRALIYYRKFCLVFVYLGDWLRGAFPMLEVMHITTSAVKCACAVQRHSIYAAYI